MLYDYKCEKCKKNIEIVKPMSEASKVEACVHCGSDLDRIFSKSVLFTGTSVKDAEFYHSLGKVIKNDYDRKETIKKHNLIEVGNEKPKAIKHHTEKHRLERIKKSYDDL